VCVCVCVCVLMCEEFLSSCVDLGFQRLHALAYTV